MDQALSLKMRVTDVAGTSEATPHLYMALTLSAVLVDRVDRLRSELSRLEAEYQATKMTLDIADLAEVQIVGAQGENYALYDSELHLCSSGGVFISGSPDPDVNVEYWHLESTLVDWAFIKEALAQGPGCNIPAFGCLVPSWEGDVLTLENVCAPFPFRPAH